MIFSDQSFLKKTPWETSYRSGCRLVLFITFHSYCLMISSIQNGCWPSWTNITRKSWSVYLSSDYEYYYCSRRCSTNAGVKCDSEKRHCGVHRWEPLSTIHRLIVWIDVSHERTPFACAAAVGIQHATVHVCSLSSLPVTLLFRTSSYIQWAHPALKLSSCTDCCSRPKLSEALV